MGNIAYPWHLIASCSSHLQDAWLSWLSWLICVRTIPQIYDLAQEGCSYDWPSLFSQNDQHVAFKIIGIRIPIIPRIKIPMIPMIPMIQNQRTDWSHWNRRTRHRNGRWEAEDGRRPVIRRGCYSELRPSLRCGGHMRELLDSTKWFGISHVYYITYIYIYILHNIYIYIYIFMNVHTNTIYTYYE